MNKLWIGDWAMELAAEARAYAQIYDNRKAETANGENDRCNRMDKWMQYQILKKIGEHFGSRYKSIAFSGELNIVEPEKLLYNERENCMQYQALYEALEEPWRAMMQRVIIHQQEILWRLS